MKPIYREGKHWPALIFGIIASILLAIGLLPPYFELAKRNGRVVGINFIFLTMDSVGAYFSIASVAVGNQDILSLILYAIVAVLELGIFLSQLIWICRFKLITKKGEDVARVLSIEGDQTTVESFNNLDVEKQFQIVKE